MPVGLCRQFDDGKAFVNGLLLWIGANLIQHFGDRHGKIIVTAVAAGSHGDILDDYLVFTFAHDFGSAYFARGCVPTEATGNFSIHKRYVVMKTKVWLRSIWATTAMSSSSELLP